jgi:hypothetical protein
MKRGYFIGDTQKSTKVKIKRFSVIGRREHPRNSSNKKFPELKLVLKRRGGIENTKRGQDLVSKAYAGSETLLRGRKSEHKNKAGKCFQSLCWF